MKIRNFTEIDSWIEARELVNKVYKMTGTEKFKKDLSCEILKVFI